jgi:RTX calcium-binding nonapeptide repeat (4 copies)
MRADTKKKHNMGKRFAILIGVAATGVMALGAQTGAQTQAPTPPGQATPTCNGKPATIVGTNGGDGLEGTQGPDVIVSLGGHDFIDGLGGNDVICGGKGKDWASEGKHDCEVEKSIEKSGDLPPKFH